VITTSLKLQLKEEKRENYHLKFSPKEQVPTKIPTGYALIS